MNKSNEIKEKNEDKEFEDFQNPLAVIQAAVDLLNRDPDNIEKALMVCKIINRQAAKLSENVGNPYEGLKERMALKV